MLTFIPMRCGASVGWLAGVTGFEAHVAPPRRREATWALIALCVAARRGTWVTLRAPSLTRRALRLRLQRGISTIEAVSPALAAHLSTFETQRTATGELQLRLKLRAITTFAELSVPLLREVTSP